MMPFAPPGQFSISARPRRDPRATWRMSCALPSSTDARYTRCGWQARRGWSVCPWAGAACSTWTRAATAMPRRSTRSSRCCAAAFRPRQAVGRRRRARRRANRATPTRGCAPSAPRMPAISSAARQRLPACWRCWPARRNRRRAVWPSWGRAGRASPAWCWPVCCPDCSAAQCPAARRGSTCHRSCRAHTRSKR